MTGLAHGAGEWLGPLASAGPDGISDPAVLRRWDGDWDDYGAVSSRTEAGAILIQPNAPLSPGAERGLASRLRHDAVELDCEVCLAPGARFVAKLHQASPTDQTSNSYHLLADQDGAYLARHHHVFQRVPFRPNAWHRVRLGWLDGQVMLQVGGLMHRFRDRTLTSGYAFVGAQVGPVCLRGLRLTALARWNAARRHDGRTAVHPSAGDARCQRGISYCIAAYRPTYVEMLIADLIRKTSVPYEILVWLNVADARLEDFLAACIGNEVPLRIVGRSPENIGMRAFRSLFAAARYPLITQTDDDVLYISPHIAERAEQIFASFPQVRQIVADVWQDEFTTGARPPMDAYCAFDAEQGLYQGPIDGWFSIYHRSVLPLLLSLPFGRYSTIGSRMCGLLNARNLLGLLCTRMRVFHAIGPQYAAHFGMLEFEIAKYRDLAKYDIVAWYRSAQSVVPVAATLEQHVALIAHSLAQPDGW